MSRRKGLAILGSTGSVGRSTLSVVAMHPELFHVTVLAAHSRWQAIVEQARQFQPATVVLVDPEAAALAQAALYLASDAASFVTGTALVVDGGGLAGSA